MTYFSRWLPTLALLASFVTAGRGQSAAPPAAIPEWPFTSAPARYLVDLNLDIPGTANGKIMLINLYLPDPKWAAMPVRVFTDTGVAVASDFITTVPGEAAALVVDSSSGAKHYQVYLGSNWPAMHLTDTKQSVWLESRDGDGTVITNLPDMLKAWDRAPAVNRRAITNGMFEGGNRFGPQTNLLTHMQGWFDVAAPEHLQFADSSADASFVLVDGKEVVEWPGNHDRGWGPAGPPQGAVDLAAGLHVVDYYNAYVASPEGYPPLSCALAVKGGAFTHWTMLTSDKPFFRPCAYGRIPVYQTQKDVPGAGTMVTAPPLALMWSIGEQCVIRTDLADIGMIQMRFQTQVDSKNEIVWTFDDGSTANGRDVTHLFLRPGLRTVHIAMKDGDKEVATLDQTVSVHAIWSNPAQSPDPQPGMFDSLLGRDPAAFSASDLVGCYALATQWLRSDALLKLAPALTAKMSEVSDADLAYVAKGAAYLAREDWTHSAEEIALLRALIDRCGKGTPTPAVVAVGSEARLALARLVYKTSDKLDDVKVLLDGINAASLTDEEPHVLQLLKADMLLAAGDVPGARKEYVRLTGDPSGPDVRSSIRRTAKIGQARAYIDSKDYDAAETALNEVAWKAPIEKLSPDWALARLRLYQEEGLPGPAFIWAKRLMPVLTETGRSELLLRLTDLAFAQGDNDLAQKTLSELLKKHPYSEEAAQAKQKWPGKG